MGSSLKSVFIFFACTCAVVISEEIGSSELPLKVIASPANANTEQPTASPQKVLEKPVQPKTPDCYQFFPGTPGWNECFQRFTQEMAEYQRKMHEFVRAKTQGEGAVNNNGGEHYSESYSNSRSRSTSYVAGYGIRAINMGLSSSVNNGVLKVTMNSGGPIENYDIQRIGNEMKIEFTVRGQQRQATISIPAGVRFEDVKVDKAFDAVYLTAPVTQDNGERIQMSQSQSGFSGSSFGSSGFNHNFPNFAAGIPHQPPPLVLPDFKNMFSNMFQNVFSLFGRPNPSSLPRVRQTRESYYPDTQMWFY